MKKLLIPLLLSISTLSYAQYPSDFTLDGLEKSYKQSLICEQSCGIFLGLKLKDVDMGSGVITLELPVSAKQLTTVALPFSVDSFNWLNFSLDGNSTNSIMTNNDRIVMAVPRGNHTVEIRAKIKNGQFKIGLLEDPKYFENKTNTVASVKNVGGSFFFELEERKKSIKDEPKEDEETSVSENLFSTPLYNIQREFFLSDKWKMRTTLTPMLAVDSNKVTNIDVPLLSGEKPLDSELELVGDKVKVSLTNGSFSWESSITPKDKMIFKNNDSKNVETWTIYNENNWLYSYEGINPIRSDSNAKYKTINTWMMWPNEQVEISFSLPTVAKGQITNVTDFNLVTNWNATPLEHTADFAITTSVGGRYVINFEDKETEAVEIKIGEQIVEAKIKNGVLPLDLTAGTHKISLLFKSGKESFLFEAPTIKFETKVTNAVFKAETKDRWVLMIGGGDIRPAILLWGILIFLGCLSYILSKLVRSPLGFVSWLLLLWGMCQTSLIGLFLVVVWIVGYSLREILLSKFATENGKVISSKFNRVQSILGGLTAIGLFTLISVVAAGLLNSPDVFIEGYNSWANNISWYIQSWDGTSNNPWIASLPITFYRVMMLFWGVWLAFSLMTWLKWMWTEYSKGGYWMKHEEPKTIVTETTE